MPLARASKEIPYFDWIFQEGEGPEPEWTGSARQWMDECRSPKHCSGKNGMNAWEKPLRRGIWMEKEKGGWLRFAWSEISAEFWRIGPRCHDSPIRSIPIFKHFAPAIGRTWYQKSVEFSGWVHLKNILVLYIYSPLSKIPSYTHFSLSLSALNSLQVRSYREPMFYNAFRKGTHPPMKWTGWLFTPPLIC